MPGVQHLYRRSSGIYFVRFCVPVRLKAAVGKGEVHRSTGCRDFRLAKIVAAELAAYWHRAIQALERMDISKVKAGSIKLLGEGYVALTDAAAALGSSPEALGRQLMARRAGFFVEDRNWFGWPVEDFHDALQEGFDELGQRESIIDTNRLGGPTAKVHFNGHLQLRLKEDVLEVLQSSDPVGICQFLLPPSKNRGLVLDLPGQPITARRLLVRKLDVESLRLDLFTQLQSISPENKVAEPASAMLAATTAEDGGERFSAFMASYLEVKEPSWKPDQVRRRRDQRDIFLELMGDLPMAQIDRHTMRRFAQAIARIPDERHIVRRKFECPDAGYSELIQVADKHQLPRMTLNAQRRLLEGMAEIFEWAVREDRLKKNPAKGLGGELLDLQAKSGVKPHQQRDALSTDDLQKVFAASWFVNGTGQKTAAGRFYAYRPHYYWLPLLALYAGGRLNELSQLYLSDIKETESGIAFIDFNLLGDDKLDIDEQDATRAGDKSLKTIAAQRQVPIHHRLIELGFLDYVRALRGDGYTRLFPELKFDKNKGYGKAAGSWFNERFLGTELQIPRNGRKTFHSLRHNFATALGDAEIAVTTKSDMMGHARKLPLVEQRYDKGAEMASIKAQLDLLTHPLPEIKPFVVADGLKAVTDALRYKASHRTPDTSS